MSDTAAEILDVAERLVQQRGFNGFSYADIASELGVTKAALHYHFAGKSDLGEALVVRYADRFRTALAEIDAGAGDGLAKVEAYTTIYLDVLRDERMCLCGMLAAEHQTLPPPIQEAVVRFFDANEQWLASVLDAGRGDGSLQFTGSALDAARMIVSTLEGAMLVARPYGGVERLRAAAKYLVDDLRSG